MLLRLALAGAVATPFLHCFVLWQSRLDAATSPIIELSRGTYAEVHTAALLSFGVAHLCLAGGLARLDQGRLWPWARLLVAAAGITLIYTAWFFMSVADQRLMAVENDPLWLVASLIGIAMGALQPGLSRINKKLGLYGAVALGLWLWLVPLAFFVNPGWVGAYERLVGIIYISWMVGVCAMLIHFDTKRPGRL